jgi:sugar O-acyltransferase (sialic acid O-acetyltransferase NeuD family)
VIGQADMLDNLRGTYNEVVVAIGNNKMRLSLVKRALALGYRIATIVHPAAYVSPTARLGAGTVVFAGAVVQTGATLGMACIVNTGATIDHDCHLGDGVHASPGVHLGGGVEVGACAWIGIGSSVREYTRLGSYVTVGAGAAVVSDFSDNVVITGVPAQVNAKLGKDKK